MGDTDVKDELKVLFSTPQNGAKLTPALVDAMADYFVEIMKVGSVDEIAIDDPDEMETGAVEAWQAAETEALPRTLAHRVRKWAGEVTASSKPTRDSPLPGVNTGDIGMADKIEEARRIAQGMGLNHLEREKAMRDMAAQGLPLERIIQLSMNLYVGRVYSVSVCMQNMKYGEDPAFTAMAKTFRKGGGDSLPDILKAKNFNKLSRHFTGLMTKYSQESMVEESALIGSWWSETTGCFHDNKDAIFGYLQEYFEKYIGRGLPVGVDPVLISAVRRVEAVGATKEDHKSLKNRVESLETQMRKIKTECAELQKKVGKGKPTAEEQEERRKNVTCHNCGVKGHYESECPEPKKK